MSKQITIAEFSAERDAVLLSMDEKRIRAFVLARNGVTMPAHPISFWGAVHKAITGQASLPFEFRRKSKAWLDKHGFQSHDDGDLDAALAWLKVNLQGGPVGCGWDLATTTKETSKVRVNHDLPHPTCLPVHAGLGEPAFADAAV